MKLLIHSFKKDLRQNFWLLGLFILLIILRVAGQSSDYCESIINPAFYGLMVAYETVLILGYLGFCGYIGFQEAPANKDHFLATRPLPLFAKLGSKMLFIGMLFGMIVLGEYYTAYAWNLNPGDLAVRISPLLFTGWATLLFGSLWRSPLALGLGCLAIVPIFFATVWGLTLLNGRYDLFPYDCNYIVLSSALFASLCLFFLASCKLKRLPGWGLLSAMPPVIFLCFYVSLNIPPKMTSAPKGTVQKAFNQPVENSIRIKGNTYITALSYGSPQLKPLYVAKPMAKAIGVHLGEERIYSATDVWESDTDYFHARGVDERLLLKEFLRPEQIEYVASKYANDYFFRKKMPNFEHLAHFEMPESLVEGELTYEIDMSHKIREYRKVASLPITEGASATFGNSTFSIIYAQGFNSSSRSYGRVSISHRSTGYLSDKYSNQRLYAIFNSISQVPTAIDSDDPGFTSRFGFLRRSLIKFDFYSDPLMDTAEKPEDRRIDIYAWVYLGVEDTPPFEITKAIEKPAQENNEKVATPVYPLLHSTQY